VVLLTVLFLKEASTIRQEPKRIERIFYTFQEAQEFLNVSHQTIYELMKQGLPSHKIGRKRVFLIEDLIRWIKEH
jgi:excisionase family DNA binding protein